MRYFSASRTYTGERHCQTGISADKVVAIVKGLGVTKFSYRDLEYYLGRGPIYGRFQISYLLKQLLAERVIVNGSSSIDAVVQQLHEGDYPRHTGRGRHRVGLLLQKKPNPNI